MSQNSVGSHNLSLIYERFTQSGCKDKGIGKLGSPALWISPKKLYKYIHNAILTLKIHLNASSLELQAH